MSRTRHEITREFQLAVADLIERYWGELQPNGERDDGLSVETLSEMGSTYPAAWVLILGVASIENPDAPALTVRFHPTGQLPFTGIGLLHDAIAMWSGAPEC